MTDALERQAYKLAITTPYSLSSIRCLQHGLMSTDLDGDALTEEETISAVPCLLKLDAALGGNSGIGAGYARMIKHKYPLTPRLPL